MSGARPRAARADAAVFRPPQRGQGPMLLAGAVGGAVVGLAAGMPPLVAALLGAVAAAVARGIRQVTGPRAVASADALEAKGVPVPFRARWEELRLGFGRARRGDGPLQRYAVVSDPAGRSLAFADLAGLPRCEPVPGADGRPLELLDLREASLLLALLVQRVPAWQLLPDWLLEPPPRPFGSGAEPGAPPPAPPGERPDAADPATAAAPRRRAGPLALVAKLGPKLLGLLAKVGGAALKVVKTTNLAWAAASAAVYSLLFSWQFAALLLLQLVVHEYGHVHAMRRTGMRVRGMYFVPFLGALAVTEDAFSSRRQQAYVALNGPLWGALLCLLPAGLYLLTGRPFWAATAAWWGVINLFNLLPISPLDGGRAMAAFAFSFSSSLGVAVGLAGLAGAVALGTAMGFSVVWIVALVGALELVAESRARAGGRALRLLPDPARFGPTHFHFLRALVGPPPGSPTDPRFAVDLLRAEQAARVEPLRRAELLGWGLLYAALAGGLLLLVAWASQVGGAGHAAQLLT